MDILQSPETTRQVENNNKIRAKFDALPSPEVNSANIKSIQRGNGHAKRVIDWLKQKDALGEYRNNDKNWDIIFNNRSVRNVIGHGAGDGKLALLEYIPDLIDNGVYLTTTIKNSDGVYREAAQNELNSTNTDKRHIFAAKANIDGEPSIVGFVVREDTNGKRYYDHEISLDDGSSAKSGLRDQDTAPISPENPSTISNIVQKHLAVNNKNTAETETSINNIRNKNADIDEKAESYF